RKNAQKSQRPAAKRRVINWTSVLKLAFWLLVLGVVAFAGFYAVGVIRDVLRPQEVAMPNLEGKTESEARALMDEAGLRYSITRQSHNTVLPDMVISQELPAGQMVKKNRPPIEIIVSSGPMPAQVPGVRGWTELAAKIEIENSGLNWVVIEEYDDLVAKGLVISQDPAAGNTVPVLSEVTIVISLGRYTGPVAVPDVAGKTVQEAETLLTANSNFVPVFGEDEYSDTVPLGCVIRQDPQGDDTALRGSEVRLIISKGYYSGPVAVPDVTGKTVQEAEALLTANNNFVPVFGEDEYSDTVPQGRVIRQDPQGDDTALRGSEVSLIVSKGPDPNLPGPVDVPDVTGKTVEEAEAILTAFTLSVTYEYSETVNDGCVIAQDPPGGDKALPGSTVNLVVSKGPLVEKTAHVTFIIPGIAGKGMIVTVYDEKPGEPIRNIVNGDHVEPGYVYDAEITVYGKGMIIIKLDGDEVYRQDF
ncbi:MAG: PASTA domain-containing protein, partial [Clostridiales bacterium]|nr:PASTA domain-containing protein [Clostridiales bacterium]